MLKNHLSILVGVLIIFSCSKSDKNTSVVPPIEENIVGLKNYGKKTGSYDESIDIFKTTNGYIAFETKNKFDVNIAYEGNADILIRKLNDNLETIDEFIFETNEYEILSSVAQIDDTRFAVSGSFATEERGAVDFFIDIINETGEVLNSKVLSKLPVSAGIGSKTSQVVFKNDVFYVTAALNGNDSVSILALDMNLDELWRKDYNFFGRGTIYVDDYVYFGLLEADGNGQEPSKTSLHYLDISNGVTVKTTSFEDQDQIGIINKIVPMGQSLYLLGSIGFKGSVIEVKKVDGQMVKETYVDDLLGVHDLLISGDDFVVSGIHSSGLASVKVDSDSNVIWKNLIPTQWGGTHIYKLLLNENGTFTFCGTAKITDTDQSTDAIYGITNLETGELE